MSPKLADTRTFPATKRVQGNSLIITIAEGVLDQILGEGAPNMEATAFVFGAKAIATQVFGKQKGRDLSIEVKMREGTNLEGVMGCSVSFSGTEKPYNINSTLAEVCLNFEPT